MQPTSPSVIGSGKFVHMKTGILVLLVLLKVVELAGLAAETVTCMPIRSEGTKLNRPSVVGVFWERKVYENGCCRLPSLHMLWEGWTLSQVDSDEVLVWWCSPKSDACLCVYLLSHTGVVVGLRVIDFRCIWSCLLLDGSLLFLRVLHWLSFLRSSNLPFISPSHPLFVDDFTATLL